MARNGFAKQADLGFGRKILHPTSTHELRELLRCAYVNAGTTMIDIADRTGLPRQVVAGVLGLQVERFPDKELYMAIAEDLVGERYPAGGAACC